MLDTAVEPITSRTCSQGVDYKDAGVILEVTPRVNVSGTHHP